MNFVIVFKTIIFSVLLSSVLFSQLSIDNQSEKMPIFPEELNIDTIPSIIEQTEQIKSDKEEEAEEEGKEKKEEEIEEKTIVVNQDWQNHMDSLLVDNTQWNSSSNIPVNSWTDTAESLAQTALSSNKSLADEIKSSFLDTINKKIKNENTEYSTETAQLITDFNNKIEEFLKEKDTSEAQEEEEKKEEEKENEMLEEIIEQKIAEQEPELAMPPTPEKVSTSLEEETDQKQKNNRQTQWEECLHNLETKGTTQQEAYNLVQRAINIAQRLSTEYLINTLKQEFYDAIIEREKNSTLYQLDSFMTISSFNESLDQFIEGTETSSFREESIAEKQFTTPEYSEYKEKNAYAQINQESYPEEFKEIKEEEIIKQELEKKKEETPSIFREEDITLQQDILEAQRAEQAYQLTLKRAEEEKLKAQKKDAIQIALAKKIQKDAEEKAAAEKAEAEKGMFAYIMQDVLGLGVEKKPEEGTTDAAEKIFESEPDVALRLKKKFAYKEFEETLLAFNTKEFWNASEKKPNDRWIKKIIRQLENLFNYELLTLETAQGLLEAAFKPNTQMTEQTKKAVINNIITELSTKDVVKKQIERKRLEELVQETEKTKAEKEYTEKERNILKTIWDHTLLEISNAQTASPGTITSLVQDARQQALTIIAATPADKKHSISKKLKEKFQTAIEVLNVHRTQQKNLAPLSVEDYTSLFNKAIDASL